VIGIDTNILLRIFETEDDPAQSLRARKAIEDHAPVYLHDVVLAEFVWTCRRTFKQSRQAIQRRLEAIVESTEFVVARPEVFERAVQAYGSQKSDFADWLIGFSNLEQGLEYTLTFDKGAARRRAFGMVDP
jgi:predicted nucleic-acid-binding protein